MIAPSGFETCTKVLGAEQVEAKVLGAEKVEAKVLGAEQVEAIMMLLSRHFDAYLLCD